MRALEAAMDGFEVMPMDEGGRGRRHLLHRDRRQVRHHPGALRADEGRRDPRQHRPLQRRDRDPGAARARRRRRARRAQFVEEFTLADGRTVYLLAEGRLVNLSAAEGHPAHVMDMSFANQALSAEYIVAERGRRSSARSTSCRRRSTTRSRGSSSRRWASRSTQLTEEQAKYLASWDEGTCQARRRGLERILEPERIVRLEDDAVVVLDQRRLPGRGGRAPLPRPRRRSPRRSGRWRCAARRRSASPRRTGWRSPRRAATTSTRRTRCSPPRARRPSTSAGRSTRCAPIRRRSARGALHAEEVERCRAMGAHAADARPAGSPGPDALQRRRARDRRLRLGGRCDPRGLGARGRRARVGRRDAAAAPGSAADRVRARGLGIPHAVIVDGAAASLHGRRGGRLRGHRRRPDRRERRHGEQDRHLRARGARAPPRDPVRTSSRRPRRSTRRRRPGRTIPIEERDGAEVSTRFPARNPAFDVTPAELIAAIVTEEGVHRAPYADVASRAGASR